MRAGTVSWSGRASERGSGGALERRACVKVLRPHAPRSTLPRSHAPTSPRSAYLLNEALVYIGVLFLLLGVGYAALYRCIDSSTVLRRNAADISRTLHTGERWRADVRALGQHIQLSDTAEGQVLQLGGAGQQVDYRFEGNTVQRRRNAGPWVTVLERVKTSRMQSDARDKVIAWRWEVELQPRAKASTGPSRVRPLFTFLAVPPSTPSTR